MRQRIAAAFANNVARRRRAANYVALYGTYAVPVAAAWRDAYADLFDAVGPFILMKLEERIISVGATVVDDDLTAVGTTLSTDDQDIIAAAVLAWQTATSGL